MNKELKQRIEQINAGTAPAGYKKTKVGIVPEEWDIIKAKKVFRNRSDKKHDGTLEVLSVTQDRGVIPRSQVDIDIKYDKESTSSYKRVYTGDFVISLRSFQGGIEYSEYNGIVSPAYTVIEASTPICDDYYRAYFKSPTYIQRLNTAVYGIRDGKNISFEDFSQIYIPFPPLPEQQKIAEILTAQDAVIALLQKQIELLQKQKKAFLQKMFPKKGCNVPEIRFAGFTDAWEERKLREIAECLDSMRVPLNADERRKIQGDIPYYGAGSIQGYINQYLFDEELVLLLEDGDAFDDFKTKSIAQYVCGKSWVNNHTHVLRPKGNAFFLFTSLEHKDIRSSTQLAGASRKKLVQDVMLRIKISVPSIDEQNRIGDFFSFWDNLITLHQRKLEIEQQKKKALMQLLLTGKVRCK